jgi:hypothetical protein
MTLEEENKKLHLEIHELKEQLMDSWQRNGQLWTCLNKAYYWLDDHIKFRLKLESEIPTHETKLRVLDLARKMHAYMQNTWRSKGPDDGEWFSKEQVREMMYDAVWRMSNWQHGYGQSRLANDDDVHRCIDITMDSYTLKKKKKAS